MVALPVALGVMLNTLLPGVVRFVAPLCPLFAVAAVALICSSVIASVRPRSPHPSLRNSSPAT